MEPSPVSQNRSGSEVDARYLQDGYWRHGRFYGSWKQGKYLFPIDSEELNRLDIFHKVFLVACQNKPFHIPVSRQAPRIMDLGTGTGIWAIHVAEEYFQGGDIMMVDLNQIQPPLIPRGVVPQQFDLEDPDWSPLWTGCDFIHMRMMLGSVQNDIWPHVYRKIFEHLAPGTGYLEHVEVDWTPRWSDETRPSDSSFVKWAELFYSGMDHFNRSARVRPQETRQMIEAAGFTDFKEEVIPAYVNPWSSDRHVRELARWFNLGLSHSVEALGLMPLVEKHGMPYEAVQELCQKVKKEICVLRFHTYCNIHIWTARKPGPPQ